MAKIPWNKDLTKEKDSRIKGNNYASKIKGKTWEEIYGKEKADQMKKKSSENARSYWKGKSLPQKIKDKISVSRKGKCTGVNHPLYGKSRSKELKDYLRNLYLGKTLEEIHGKKEAERIKKVLCEKNTGRKHTFETKEKIRNRFLGISKSIEQIEKMRKTKIERGSHALQRNSNWRGGISFEEYGREFNNKLKEKIKQRDDYTCQLCNKIFKLLLHHIDYDKKNNCDENLISLCRQCHTKTNFNRTYWTKYFQNLLENKYNYFYPQEIEIIINN